MSRAYQCDDCGRFFKGRAFNKEITHLPNFTKNKRYSGFYWSVDENDPDLCESCKRKAILKAFGALVGDKPSVFGKRRRNKMTGILEYVCPYCGHRWEKWVNDNCPKCHKLLVTLEEKERVSQVSKLMVREGRDDRRGVLG